MSNAWDLSASGVLRVSKTDSRRRQNQAADPLPHLPGLPTAQGRQRANRRAAPLPLLYPSMSCSIAQYSSLQTLHTHMLLSTLSRHSAIGHSTAVLVLGKVHQIQIYAGQTMDQPKSTNPAYLCEKPHSARAFKVSGDMSASSAMQAASEGQARCRGCSSFACVGAASRDSATTDSCLPQARRSMRPRTT